VGGIGIQVNNLGTINFIAGATVTLGAGAGSWFADSI